MEFPKRKSVILDNLRKKKNFKESQKTKSRMLLAARIISGIQNKGWNRITFAEKINQEPSVITKWLSGTHNFTSDTLIDIQDILDIQLIQLEQSTPPRSLSINATGDITVFVLTPESKYTKISENAIKLDGIGIEEVQITTTVSECSN